MEKREGFSEAEKRRMLLSQETIAGINITGEWLQLFFKCHIFMIHGF